ncbi:MAG: hypothetical protein WCT01_02085 [Candidatus Shapirobacteria bacterium]
MRRGWIIILAGLILGGCGTEKTIVDNKVANPTNKPTTVIETVVPSVRENKMCSWIDSSEVILKLKFEEGVVKDTSYETGFIYKKGPNMVEMKLARLARDQCDYRVGYNKSDFEGIKGATIGVWTFNGTIQQKIKGAPITVQFIDGMPDFGKNLEVEVLK